MVINPLYCTVNLSYPHNPSHEMYVWSPNVSGIKIFFMTWWTPKLSSTVVGKDNDNYKIGIQGPCPTPFSCFWWQGPGRAAKSWYSRYPGYWGTFWKIIKIEEHFEHIHAYFCRISSHFKEIDTLYLDKLLLLK